jgi:hypothetical protein
MPRTLKSIMREARRKEKKQAAKEKKQQADPPPAFGVDAVADHYGVIPADHYGVIPTMYGHTAPTAKTYYTLLNRSNEVNLCIRLNYTQPYKAIYTFLHGVHTCIQASLAVCAIRWQR